MSSTTGTTTAAEIDQHIQRIWAARNDNNNADPLAKTISQEEYDSSIRSRVSPEDFADMTWRMKEEYSNPRKPRLCTRTAATLTLDDMAYLGSQQYHDALRLDAEREAKEIQQKQDEEKLAMLIVKHGEPPVLCRKDKGNL